MTRWARGGTSQGKRELEATPWSKLQGADSDRDFQSSESRDQKRHVRPKTKNRGIVEESEQSSPVDVIERTGARKRGSGNTIRKGLLHSFMPDEGDNNSDKDSGESENEGETGVADILEKTRVVHKSQEEEEGTDEIKQVLRKEERREKRRMKRINQRKADMVCFKCRKQGHDIANCPKLRTDNSQGTGICFKCGSTEHSIQRCNVKLPDGIFPYAKCFICNEIGHLSKQCPDNPKGLYPNGGCCKWCGSVEHYKRDCPELKKKQGIDDVKLDLWTPGTKRSVDEDTFVTDEVPLKKAKVFRKIVKF